MCKNIDEIIERIGWLGTNLQSRKKLLASIQIACKPINMLKANKMEV